MKYALTNCKILNGKKDMTPTPGFVLVDGDKIEDVFYNSAFEKEKYPDFEIIDLGGKYLMPGLINMHVHLAGNGKPQKKQRDNAKLVKLIMSNALTRSIAYKMVCNFAKLELFSGVTTIRTVGGLSNYDTKLRDEAKNGKKTAPRIITSNRAISVPDGHMAGSVAVVCENVNDALAFLEREEKENIDFVKLMVTGGVMDATEKGVPGILKMKPEMIKAVCDKAHSAGYKVAAHVESTEGVLVSLKNGVDSIEHGAKPTDEMISLFKERGAFLCTTVSAALPYALFDRSISNVSETEQFNGNVVFEGIIECAKAAIKNDIPVAIGNDVGCPWITQYDFWREVYFFAKYVGVSNTFALYTATARNAELAGVGNLTGTIEKGKFADIIVTKNNPIDDLRALEKVDTVIASGIVYDKPKYKINTKVKTELDKFTV